MGRQNELRRSGATQYRRAIVPARPAAISRDEVPPSSGMRDAGPGPYQRRLRRARGVLAGFAMLACVGIAAVLVSGPNVGATASPYYQEPVKASAADVQKFEIDGGYVLVDVKRDKVKIVKPVVPDPVVAASGAGGGAAADTGGGATYTTPSGTAQAYAAQVVASRGWGPGEFTCLVNLWNKESGWNTHAANPSSGAYGIPQALPGSKMASAGADWRNDHKVQINWGLGYITGRYGSPCGAWASSQSRGWY